MRAMRRLSVGRVSRVSLLLGYAKERRDGTIATGVREEKVFECEIETQLMRYLFIVYLLDELSDD